MRTREFIDRLAFAVYIAGMNAAGHTARASRMQKICVELAAHHNMNPDLSAMVYVRANRMMRRIELKTMQKNA